MQARCLTVQQRAPVLADEAQAQPGRCVPALSMQAAEGDGPEDVSRQVRCCLRWAHACQPQVSYLGLPPL